MLREPKYDWFSVEAQRDAQEREEQNFREAMRALVRFLGFVAVDGSGFWWGGAWEGIDRQVEPMPLPTTGLFEAAGDIKVDPDGNLQFAERLGDMVLP